MNRTLRALAIAALLGVGGCTAPTPSNEPPNPDVVGTPPPPSVGLCVEALSREAYANLADPDRPVVKITEIPECKGLSRRQLERARDETFKRMANTALNPNVS